jgi:hypothetical protein
VREKPELVDDLVRTDPRVAFVSLSDAMASGVPPPASAGTFTNVLLCLLHTECRYMSHLVKQCTSAMAQDAACHVFIYRPHGRMPSEDLLFDVMRYLEDAAGRYTNAAVCSYVGSPYKRANDWLLSHFGKYYARYGLLSMLWIAPALLISLPLTLLTNAYLRLSLPTTRFIRSSSSVLIRLG